MSKKLENHFIVKIFVDTVHDLEKVYDKTVGLIKDSKKLEHTSIVTKVPKAFWDDDVMGMNAAERALTRIEERFWDPLESGSEQGLLLAKDILQEELAKYHGE